jgi:hypothetical protein
MAAGSTRRQATDVNWWAAARQANDVLRQITADEPAEMFSEEAAQVAGKGQLHRDSDLWIHNLPGKFGD